ncbi:hypothetical protein LCGC14_2795720 [marine sediment metagenome]|uniref:Uncharacterized protein n=1 Tax=marine sediment metagenome TaxID=412755 RepID=A0A0F9BFL1_9ZZZZ
MLDLASGLLILLAGIATLEINRLFRTRRIRRTLSKELEKARKGRWGR